MSLFLKRMGREETFSLSPDKEKIVIGRSTLCDISFSSMHISRQHCQIIRSPPNGALVIKNMRDTNCTYVNELKLQDPDTSVELQVGFRIGLGVPLELATEAGMRNNNFVFLKLEGSQSSLQTRQNEARTTEEKRNIEVGVHCQPGEPPPTVTSSAYPSRQDQRVPTEGLKPHSVSSSETMSSELVPAGSICPTTHNVPPLSLHSGMSQTASAATTSNASGLKERFQQNAVGNEVRSAEKVKHVRQAESSTEQCGRVKPKIVVDENSVTPLEARNSNHEPKQICSSVNVSDLHIYRKVTDQKDEASVSKIQVSEPASFCDISSPPSHSATLCNINGIEEPSSPMSIDLTQADPDSPVRKENNRDSHKLEEIIANNLISLASPDVQIISSPENKPQGNGKQVSGKRKRVLNDEPPGSASETENVHVSIKKKVKGSSLSHARKGIVFTDETSLSRRTNLDINTRDPNKALMDSNDNEGEPLFLKTTNHCSSKSDTSKTSGDSDSGSELLFQIESDQKTASKDSDTDDDSLFSRRKAKQNSVKCKQNNQSENCDSEGGPLVRMQKNKENSYERDSQMPVVDSDSNDDSLFLGKNANHDSSKCDQSKASADSESESEPLLRKRKPGRNAILISSSDDDSDIPVPSQEKTRMRKDVEKIDLFSCFNPNFQNCTVNLKKLPTNVSENMPVVVGENSLVEDNSASSAKKEQKDSGDEICISDSDGNESSQKSLNTHKRKRKTFGESKLSLKHKESVMQKHAKVEQQKYGRLQNERLGEHSSHTVIENTSGEDSDLRTLDECISSAPLVSSISADSEQSNKMIETNKISSDSNSKENEKLKIEEPSKNIVEVFTETKIKAEPDVSGEENDDSARNDAKKDEVVFMYSQVGEEIWLSSDDEEDAAPPSGPASTSLDDELDFLFAEDDEQKLDSVEGCSSPEKMPVEVDGSEANDQGNNDDDEDEDQWFPVLSQSFLESTDEEDNKDEECNKDSKDASPITINSEPSPGPSGVSEPLPDNEENESDEWWPILSQGFFDDIEPELEEKEKEEVVSSNNSAMEIEIRSDSTRAGSTSDLQSVIEKLRKKGPRTSRLTEAKIPLQKSRRNKQKRDNQMERNKHNKSVPSAAINKKNNEQKKKKERQSASENIVPVNKIGKKNKSPDLRKTLTSKFNLESYKTTIECRTKEKHHLVSKNKDKPNTPPSSHPPCKSSNERTALSKDSENISIQKKAKPVASTSQDKGHSKVAAKVTKKSRFEKLIDCDIFSKPSKNVAASKRSSFKIPKSSGAKTSRTSSAQSEAQGGGLVLDKRKSSKAAGNSGKPALPDATVSSAESTSENTDNEKQTLSSSDAVKNDTCGRIDDISKDLKKVNLKSKSRKVHFPQKEEDLVKVLLISPRKKGEKTGLPSVRARETLPEELMLQRQNIPPHYMDIFIHHVCHWNYDWLESYHRAQEKYRAGVLSSIPAPPPVVSSTNYPTLILYSSYNDYRETHSSLFYLELWERVYRDWIPSKYKSFSLQALIEFVKPAFIRTPSGALKFWAVKLMVAIPQTHSINFQDFRQGTLLSLKVQKEGKKSVIFGYIDHMTMNNRRMTVAPQQQGPTQMNHSFSLGVRVAKETIQTVKLGTVIAINCISYIRPNSRVWESLCKLPISPLCKDILSPSLAAFSCEKETKYLIENFPLNEMQEKAVTTVSGKCMYDPHIPKLSLIHGPPGTGKTSTIVALVAQMVVMGRSLSQGSKPNCRILICAPSNAAVDELTLRLIRLRDFGLSLRVVRVGFKVSDHPLVRNCTLDQFVSKQVKMEVSTPRCESARQEWQRRNILVQQIAEELEKARKEGKRSEVRQLEVRLNEMARAKAEFEKSFKSEPSGRERYELQQKWQQEFLLKAEVVTTTLNSCVSGAMSEVLSKHLYHFTCCIVDEAGQCQETETLLPLLLGIRKLVLVGDHHQLPATVLSQLALNKNLKQSLFERLYHRLVLELQREDVVHTLSMQYRMHPEIVEWPGQHFYMNKLITSPELVTQTNMNLKPYLIFDLKTSQEQRLQNQEMYNPAEASLVCVLLEVLQPHLNHKTVGVITPYQRQRFYLEEKLAKFKGIINLTINTIDGFQGQERDVIILSFVRANNAANIGFLSHRQRLNVALTRAKKICYIIASVSSLEGNKEWNSLIRNGRMRGLVCPVTSKEENDKNFLRGVVESRDCNAVPKDGIHR